MNMAVDANAVTVNRDSSFQTTEPSTSSLVNATFFPNAPKGQFNYILYGVVMSFILLLGFIGNVLTIIVLRQKEHRKKMIVPFIINLAAADLFIVVFGYPVAVSSILSRKYTTLDASRCKWSAFVNSSTGIASIITFTVISAQMRFSVTSKNTITRRKLPTKVYFAIIGAIWSYGIFTSCPPLLGWSTFVRGAAGISCGPDWSSTRLEDRAYSVFLVFTGFVLPLFIISLCYYKIIRVLRLKDYSSSSNQLRQAWQRSQKQIIQMIGVSIVTFLLSWSPYCIVSVMSAFTGRYALKPGTAEIPELLAKASIVYNPFVYTAMNVSFRRSLKKVVFKCLRSGQKD